VSEVYIVLAIIQSDESVNALYLALYNTSLSSSGKSSSSSASPVEWGSTN